MNTVTRVMLLAVTTVLMLPRADAAYYDVPVPAGGSSACAYSFNTNTVANAVGTVPEGTMLEFWDADEQEWVLNTYEFGEWTDPDYVMTPGTGFMVVNPTNQAMDVRIYGTALTQSSYTMVFEAEKFYFVGSAYPLNLSGGNFLEAIPYGNPPWYRYTPHSLNYWANVGDLVYTWETDGVPADTWEINERLQSTPTVGDYWDGEGLWVSPTIELDANHPVGCGFFLYPAENTTWIHLRYGW